MAGTPSRQSFCKLPTRPNHKYHEFSTLRPRVRRKDFFFLGNSTLGCWACTRKSSDWSRMRREFPSCGGPFVPHVWSGVDCGVGVDLARGKKTSCTCRCCFLSGYLPLPFRRRESRRDSGKCGCHCEAVDSMYVPCWANISDHRGVECLATIISPYQVHMHVPFTCARTGGVETRGDCEHGHRCDLRQEVLQFAPQSFVMSVHNPQQQTIGARRPVSCPRFG